MLVKANLFICKHLGSFFLYFFYKLEWCQKPLNFIVCEKKLSLNLDLYLLLMDNKLSDQFLNYYIQLACLY